MAQNWLHILSSWLLLPRHTFKKINQEKCYPHIFPPPFFFSALKQQLHCFAFALQGMLSALAKAGERSHRRRSNPPGCWLRAVSEVGTPSSPSGTFIPLPLPLSLLGLWDHHLPGGPQEWAKLQLLPGLCFPGSRDLNPLPETWP